MCEIGHAGLPSNGLAFLANYRFSGRRARKYMQMHLARKWFGQLALTRLSVNRMLYSVHAFVFRVESPCLDFFDGRQDD